LNSTPDTEAKITKLIPLDPLHAPAHLVGFHAFKKRFRKPRRSPF
jgi:acetate kinase